MHNDFQTTIPGPWRNRFGYYVALLGPAIAYVAIVHLRCTVFRSPTPLEPSPFLFALRFIWIVPAAWVIVAVSGLLGCGAPRDARPGPGWAWDSDVLLIVTFVSRGNHPDALRRSTATAQSLLDQYRVRYQMEVVTQIAIAPEDRVFETTGPVFYELVPSDYETPRGTRFKARNLQYLVEHREERLKGETQNVWILHFDEESTLTPEAIEGIREFISRHDLRQSQGAIGEGELIFNRGRFGSEPHIDAIDAVRTGEDLGRFRLQFLRFHRPAFGFHGTFLLLPEKTERAVTWDAGPHGSLAEDAWFAYAALQKGFHFDWIHGFIREQSPFSLKDVIEQRRRWFNGWQSVLRDPHLDFSTTLLLRLTLIFWFFVPAGIIAGMLAIVTAIVNAEHFPYWMLVSMAIAAGAYNASYLVGAYRNCLHSDLTAWRRLRVMMSVYLGWLVLWPAVVEGVSVLYAVACPARHFHVVTKSAATAS